MYLHKVGSQRSLYIFVVEFLSSSVHSLLCVHLLCAIDRFISKRFTPPVLVTARLMLLAAPSE